MKAQEAAKDHESSAANAVLTARALVVRNRADMIKAVEFIRALMDGVDKVDGAIDEFVRPLEGNIKELKSFFKTPKTMFQTAIGAAKSVLYDAMKADEGERRVEQEKLAVEAREKSEALYMDAVEEKDPAKAIELRVQADMITVPALPDDTSLDGAYIRENWKAVMTDLELFVTAIASGDLPMTLIKADMVALNKMATAQKGMGKVPGVAFKKEETLVVRR